MKPSILSRFALCGAAGIAFAGMYSAYRHPAQRPAFAQETPIAVRRQHIPTVSGALSAYGEKADRKFLGACRQTGISYPPKRVSLIAFKEEKRLEVWGANRRGPYKRLAVYPILAASGVSGPKRMQGDCQVPEGFYRISALNPASRFHLSLRVDYPNKEDIDHRVVPQKEMGNDIYVHGGAVSIGCLALGDPAIEEVFCLMARADYRQRRIVIAPRDLRIADLPQTSDTWVAGLHRRLQKKLQQEFPA